MSDNYKNLLMRPWVSKTENSKHICCLICFFDRIQQIRQTRVERGAVGRRRGGGDGEATRFNKSGTWGSWNTGNFHLNIFIQRHGHLRDNGCQGNLSNPVLSTCWTSPSQVFSRKMWHPVDSLLKPDTNGPPIKLIQVLELATPMHNSLSTLLQTLIVPPPCQGRHQACEPRMDELSRMIASPKNKTQTDCMLYWFSSN